MFASTFKELLAFLRKPKEHIAQSEPTKSKIKLLFTAYLIFLLPVMLSSSFFLLAEHFEVINGEDHKLIDMLGDTPVAVTLFLVAVMAPIWEELIFRLPLRWERAYLFQIFLSPLRLGGKATYQNGVQGFHTWWQKNYTYVFYFTVFAFGLIHVANFKAEGPIWQLMLWAPLLVMPQILLGSLLGFIRLRLGFWWAVLLHGSHNLLFVSIALLAPAEAGVHQTENYRLTYEWISADQLSTNVNNQIEPNEVSFEQISVDDLFRFLITNDSSRYQATDTTGQKMLKLDFKPKVSTLDLKRLLVQALEEHLDLSLERTKQPIDLFEVTIGDESKLVAYEQGPEAGSQIQISPDSLIFQYTNLKKITASLQEQHWGNKLRYAGDDYNLYEIRLLNLDFEELQKELSGRYGLKISGPKVDSVWMYRLK